MKFPLNKKAQANKELFVIPILAFVFIIIVGVLLYTYGTFSDTLSNANIIAGDTNISNYSSDTVGKVNQGFHNSADIIAVLFIFGYVIALFLAGYLMRDSTPPFFFLVDFVLIIVAYIISTYLSNAYETFISAIPFASTYSGYMSSSSSIMLYLPRIIIVAGVIAMIITYSGIPKTRQEEVGGI